MSAPTKRKHRVVVEITFDAPTTAHFALVVVKDILDTVTAAERASRGKK